MSTDPERFLRAAVETGRLRPDQADDCRRLLAALDEVQVELDVAEVAVRKGFLEAEQVVELKRELARRRVGKYEILERLGEGATGVVWKARDTKLDRDVALKILSRKVEDLEPFRERFFREARVAVTLNHVNIVRGLDSGASDGYHWFAMELVPGESLAERLEWEGRLPEADAVAIARDVVEALRYVEQFGLVHRDIKPENLLLPPGGPVKLADLGLAKPTLEEWQRIADEPTAGTPYYMAPEQIRSADSVDWRTDVYGLGATLFHALTGEPPFKTDADGSVLHKHMTRPAPSPREHVIDLSAGVTAVVLKMLRKEPDERYASLDDLAADLDALLAGRPPVNALSLSSSDSGTFEARPRGAGVRRKSKAPARLAIALLFAGGAVAAWGLWFAPPEEPPPRRTAGPAPVVPDDPPVAVDPVPDQRDPDPAPPAPTPEELERLKTARTALALADGYRTQDPPDLAQAREQYRFVLERYDDLPEAQAARTGLDLVLEALSARADALLEGILADVAVAESEGRLGDAFRLLNGFPIEHADTAAGKRAAEQAERVRKAARELNVQAGERMRVAIKEFRFDQARRLLAEAVRTDLDPASGPYDFYAKQIDEQEQDYRTARNAEASAFGLWAGQVVRTAVTDGLGEAQRRFDEGAFPYHGAELEGLRRDLVRLDEARLRVARATDPSDEGPAEADGVPRVIDDGGAPLLRGWILAELGRGRLEAARGVIAARELAASGVPRLEQYVAYARGALEAEVGVLVGEARSHREAGRLRSARDEVRRALELLPGASAAYLELAEIELRARRFSKAKEALEAAKPHPLASLGLARLHVKAGDLQLAEQELNDALAHAEFDEEQRQEALALRADVRDRRTRQRVRKLELRLARESGADLERLCREILDLEPNHAEALFRLGRSLVDEKGATWERIVDGSLLLERFVALTASSRRDSRLDTARELLDDLSRVREEVDPSAVELGRLAVVEARAGDPFRAEELAEKALAKQPFLQTGQLGLGLARLERVRRSGGSKTGLVPVLAVFDRLLRLNGDNLDARVGRAEARLLDGNWSGALQDARLALEADGTRAAPALLAGRAHLHLDDPSAALSAFQTAYERSPGPEAIVYQAQAHLRLGQHATARRKLIDDLAQWEIPADLAQLVDRLRGELGLDEE